MVHLIISVLLVSLAFVEASLYGYFFGTENDLNLEWALNPSCGSKCANGSVNFVDVGERNSNERWLWDITNVPAVYSIFTQRENEEPVLDWNRFLNHRSAGSLKYGPKTPRWTSSIILESLVEVNDTKDDMHLDYSRCGIDDSYCRIYPMELFTWDRKVLVNTSKHLSIQFVSNNLAFSNPQKRTGKINITVSAFIEDGYGTWLPHLAHNFKTCEVDIQLDGLKTGSNFTNSRFGLQFLIGSSNPKGKFTPRHTESLNDEHTPGIFKTYELLFPGRNTSENGYIQWRPIVYSKPHRGLADSTGVSMSKGHKVEHKVNAFINSSLYAIYGDKVGKFSARYYYVGFGAPKDGFYNKTRYNAWTFTLGHGDPIDGTLSHNVILASTVMAFVVILSIIVSSSFCLYKRWKNRSAEPQFSYGQI